MIRRSTRNFHFFLFVTGSCSSSVFKELWYEASINRGRLILEPRETISTESKGAVKRATCFATLLQNELNSDAIHATCNNLTCCKTGLNVSGRTRNIAFSVVVLFVALLPWLKTANYKMRSFCVLLCELNFYNVTHLFFFSSGAEFICVGSEQAAIPWASADG